MIIVSQDKSIIVNLNNVEAIEIGNIEENQCKGTIYARLLSDYFYKIGEYKTEERAKEVLIGIMQSRIDSENYKYVNALMTTEELNRLQKGLVYEMPED